MPEPLVKQIVILIVSLALFMEALDSTIINTAIPAISQSLHINPIDLKLALISYLLSLAIFIPISGWVADKYGAKQVFIFASSIFLLSSLWCGFSRYAIELSAARFLQGLGGALMLPVARLIMLRTVSKPEMIIVMNRVVMLAAFGVMLGPVFGGIITHYASWEWIFWVNIPIGVITILIACYRLQDYERQAMPALDKTGFVLFGAGLAGFTLGFSAFSDTMVSDRYALTIILFAIVLLISYGWHSYRQPYPILNTALLRIRTFQISALGNLLARLGFEGIPFLIPLLLQISLGYSVLLSGLLLAPMALGIALVKPFVMYLLRSLGYKKLLMLSTVLLGLSVWSFMWVGTHTSLAIIVCLTFIFGFLTSLQYSTMNSLAYADLSLGDYSSATSIVGTVQRLSQSFGIALSAIFIRLFSPTFTAHSVLTVSILHHAFFAMGCTTFLAVFIFMRLSPTDGYSMLARDVS